MILVLALVLLAVVVAVRPAARALSRARRRAEQDAHRRATVRLLASLRPAVDREQVVEVSDPALGVGCGRVVVDDGPWPVEVPRERGR